MRYSSSFLTVLAFWFGATATLHAQQAADSVQPESVTIGAFSSLDPKLRGHLLRAKIGWWLLQIRMPFRPERRC